MVVAVFEVQVLTRPSHQERESGPDPTEEIQFYKLVWVMIQATGPDRRPGAPRPCSSVCFTL